MKMAKATKADIKALQNFFDNLDQKAEHTPDAVLARYVRMTMKGLVGSAHHRVTIGCDILIDNCCDPDKSYLDFKPELKALIPETENEQGEKLFYIISYKNSDRGVLTFFNPKRAGYTTNIRRAGKYTESEVRAQMNYYHQGESATAVPVEEIHSDRFLISENVWMNWNERQKHEQRVKAGILDDVKEEVPSA